MQGLLVVSRYLLIGPDGKVLKVDKMHWGEDGHFSIELTERLPAGQYTLVLGILLDGNALDPAASILHFRVDATGLLAKRAQFIGEQHLQAGADPPGQLWIL